MVIILVLGRWLLPRGKITREKLSDILLGFTSMSADILGLFQMIHGSGTSYDCELEMSIIGLAISNLSMLQIPFDLDFSIGNYRKEMESKEGRKLTLKERFDNPEVRTILMNTFMHEAPFLIMRIYYVAAHANTLLEVDNLYDLLDNGTQGVFFYAAKNVLFLALQGYRLWILMKDENEDTTGSDEDNVRNENDHNDEFVMASNAVISVEEYMS